MTLRQVALKVHLWTSLAFSAVILVACLTGSALVYRHDIDRALNPSLYRTTPGDVGWDAVWQAVASRYSPARGVLIRGPVDRGVYQVEIGDGLLPFSVHVDPGTGQILGAREPARTLSGWLFLLHFNIFAGEVGHQLIGVTGVALLLITAAGAWLWWPTLRRLAFGFRIRWARPLFVVNYDLHRVIGIWSLPLVLVLSLTGAILVFYEVGGRFVYALFFTTPEAAAPAAVPEASGPLTAARPATLNQAAALAVRLAPDAVASSMYVPGGTREPVRVWLRTPGDMRPNVGSWHAEIDRATGLVVSAMVPSNTPLAAHVEESWVIALHFGTFGGEAIRALYAVAGLVPVVLLITGVVHWLLRRRPRTPVPSLED
jgi:uncharacterized iron-regulated membrane protein